MHCLFPIKESPGITHHHVILLRSCWDVIGTVENKSLREIIEALSFEEFIERYLQQRITYPALGQIFGEKHTQQYCIYLKHRMTLCHCAAIRTVNIFQINKVTN